MVTYVWHAILFKKGGETNVKLTENNGISNTLLITYDFNMHIIVVLLGYEKITIFS